MENIALLALWLHFMSIGMAGMATLGIPVAMMASKGAKPDQRPAVGAILMKLSAFGRMALALLVLSGVVLIWARYSGGGLNGWFHAKMALVVALVAVALFNKRNGMNAMAGDAAAVARAPMMAKISMALFAGVVLMAVLAFG